MRVFFHLSLELVCELLSGNVRLIIPGIFFCRLLNLGEILLGWLNRVGNFLGGISSDVAQENNSVTDYRPSTQVLTNGKITMTRHTQLAELSIGDYKSTQSLQSLRGIGGILFGAFPVHRRPIHLCYVRGPDMLRFPDELLQKVAFIFCDE